MKRQMICAGRKTHTHIYRGTLTQVHTDTGADRCTHGHTQEHTHTGAHTDTHRSTHRGTQTHLGVHTQGWERLKGPRIMKEMTNTISIRFEKRTSTALP